jgi:hypothetical protein
VEASMITNLVIAFEFVVGISTGILAMWLMMRHLRNNPMEYRWEQVPLMVFGFVPYMSTLAIFYAQWLVTSFDHTPTSEMTILFRQMSPWYFGFQFIAEIITFICMVYRPRLPRHFHVLA